MPRMNRRRFLQSGAAALLGLGIGLRGPLLKEACAQAFPVATTAARALADLRHRLNGTLMLPDDSGYSAASTPANGRYRNILPIAVARCADEADVVTCVQWCNENGVSPVARGGGHSYAGFSTTTGLLVDLRRLNSVHLDKKTGVAVAGGAALNNDFFVASEDGDWFLPGGTCLGVGVGGLCLGGGIGYNTHWAGLTCDRLTASRIVIASGAILDLDASNNSDLFWACRGGAGGSFGFNTQFTFDLVKVPITTIGWYRFEWRGADAAVAVLTAFDQMMQSAPAALNAVAMAQASAVGPDGPRAAIDVMSRGQYIGPFDELQELLRPLAKIGTLTMHTLEETRFWDTQRLIATAEPAIHAFGDISRYANKPIPDDVISKMVDLLTTCPSRSDDNNGSIWSLGWVGGDVMNAIGRTETAYVHRGVTTLYRPTTVWSDDAPESVGNDLNAWSESIIDTLKPHTPEESYQNFPNRSLQNWQELYYAENFDRLVAIKTKYDPNNLFNNPQSIPIR